MNDSFDTLPPGYAELPVCVAQYLTPREYLWLSDAEKANLIQSETEPDFET